MPSLILILPGVNLARMHTEPARQLGHRAFLPNRRQRHFRLELRTVFLPSIRQVSPLANRPLQGETLLATLCGRPGKWQGICAVRARPVAPPISVVSPVRSPLAARQPGVLRHNRAVPARHRALPPSRCLRGRRAGCPAIPETGPAGPPESAPRHPTVAVDCADRQAGGIEQSPTASSAQPRQWLCAAPDRLRIARRGSRRDRRGVVVPASELDIP